MKNVDNRQKQSIQSRASRGFAETRKYFAHLPQDENKVPNPAKKSEEGSHHGEAVSEGAAVHRTSPKAGRNEPCPCGSGKKYKKCCLGKEDPVKK